MAYTYYKIEAFSGGWHDGEIGVEVSSQSISGNYSVVNLVLRVRETTSASSYNNGGANVYLSIDGVQQVTSDSIDFRDFATGTWYTILSKTGIKVYHGTNGTKSISVKGYCATGVGAGTYNQTQSVTLPTIPRKSSVTSITSPVECNGSNAVTVNISRADASFTHKVTFSLGGASQQYTGVATSQAFTIPLTWLNQITTDVQAVANCRVETFSGTTSLGYVDEPFTVKVPTSVIPVVNSITFSKVSDVFSSGVYVQGISKVQGTASSITNQYSATTTEYNWFITNDLGTLGTPYVGATFTSGILGLTGTLYVVLKVKDSRGRWSAAYSQAITVYAYASPSLTVTGERCDAAGVINPNGEYIKVRIQATVSAVNNDNTKTYTLKYKKTSDSTWTSIDVSGLTTYTVDGSYVRSASSSYTWEVQATVTDKVGTIAKTATVTTASVLMDFLAGGTGIAFGKVAEIPDMVESQLPMQLNDGIYVDNRLVKPYLTATGDCNTITDEWHIGGNGSANYPIVATNVWWYVNTIWHIDRTYGKQIAHGFGTTSGNRVFIRRTTTGQTGWTAWVEVLTNDNYGVVTRGLTGLTSSGLASDDAFMIADYSDSDKIKKTGLGSIAAWVADTEDVAFTDGVCSFSGTAKAFIHIGLVQVHGTMTVKTGQSISANTTTSVLTVANSLNYPAGHLGVANFYRTDLLVMGYIAQSTGVVSMRSPSALSAGATIYFEATWYITPR